MLYLLFANVLILFSESAEGLQKQLTALYSDASLWHIIVSIPKTFIIFNERYPTDIEKTEQYQYLGVVYSTKSVNNVLKETFSHLASQAGRAIFSLRKQSRPVVGKLSPTIAFKVFDCQILPILEYGSDTWYTHDTGDDVNDLEKKNQSHPVKNSNNMLLELGVIGVRVFALSSNEPGLIKLGNRRILVIQNNSCFHLMNQLLGYLLSSGEKILRVRVSCVHNYALVKQYFCFEPYILHIRGNHLITAIARYRMSSHDLKIERERYNNPITPINQRICTRCESNEIDDEIHLLTSTVML